MSLAIRLSRGGAKKHPFYRIVVADSRNARDGKFIERLGTYDPMLSRDNPDRVKLVEDRIKHWLSVGAKPSDRVQRFLSEVGIMEKPAFHDQPKKSKPKAKAVERMAANAEAQKAAAEAAAAPAPEEAPVEEAAAEEAVAEEVVAEEAPAEEAPAEEAAAEEAVVEEAAAEEAPAEDAAVEDGEDGKAAE